MLQPESVFGAQRKAPASTAGDGSRHPLREYSPNAARREHRAVPIYQLHVILVYWGDELSGSSTVLPIPLAGAVEQKHSHLTIAFCGTRVAGVLALKLIGIVDGEHCGQCLGH